MKGIILAGGKGTRLHPLTEITNKHLLPVGREPMIWHPVRQLLECGIKEILVITSNDHMGDVVNSLGSGKRFNCEFTYRVQEEAGGIAHALMMAKSFVGRDRCIVLLGDNIFEYSIAPFANQFREQKVGARVLLKEVKDPERFGIAALDEHHIIEIAEKPSQPKSNLAVVGCYMYDDQLFDLIQDVKYSARGEMEITALNNIYLGQTQLEFSIVNGRWTDAGTFESLIEANSILLNNENRILQST